MVQTTGRWKSQQACLLITTIIIMWLQQKTPRRSIQILKTFCWILSWANLPVFFSSFLSKCPCICVPQKRCRAGVFVGHCESASLTLLHCESASMHPFNPCRCLFPAPLRNFDLKAMWSKFWGLGLGVHKCHSHSGCCSMKRWTSFDIQPLKFRKLDIYCATTSCHGCSKAPVKKIFCLSTGHIHL